jgi:formate dehydrogenase iron-sulfur subunit
MPAPSLLEELLADQRSLTAVEQFARAHDSHALAPGARSYRNLIPLEAPQAGEQYAFEVALDKCSGCKACVTACHSLNGLDDNETWREVGLLLEVPQRHGWQGRLDGNETRNPKPETRNISNSAFQHVTTACHHCVDPACLNGCPVLAYEKDPVTGIVRHLDDQCIGCQYCVLKCPYDVPKYNDRLGIVRKCDMCSNRLAVGEAPACVQACPNEAIRITKVSTSEVTIEFRERSKDFLTGAPAGNYTVPTTRYIVATEVGRGVHTAPRTEFSNALETTSTSPPRAEDSAPYLVAADAAQLNPQPAHWPLVFMLVLSQASVGTASAAAWFQMISLPTLLMSLALGVAGLTASVFHLGRPLGAWRAFLNLKRSWMSREIVVFGAYVPLLVMALLAMAIGTAPVQPVLIAAAIVGLLGVFCSAMIYHDTRRPLWHWRRSVLLFGGSTIGLGAAAVATVFEAQALPGVIIAATLFKLMVEIHVLQYATDEALTPLKKTALLLTGRFQHITLLRLTCAMLGGVCLPLLLTMNVTISHTLVAAVAFALLLFGEVLERFLFFTTVVAPKMPGGLPT